MTTPAETTLSEKEQEKAALKAREKEIAAKELDANKDRTGKGLRIFFGMTRGRNPQMIQYENWDVSKPDTLPVSLSEFMDLRKLSDEKDIVRCLISGDNDILYAEASDPISEFVDLTWSEDVQKQFRLVVKNYANATGKPIEEVVALIKPGIVASQQKA